MPEASPIEISVGCPEEACRIRSRTRWAYGDFVFGLGAGLLVTAVRVAKVGYEILPFALVWNLI
ncbi:hypothetical protein [Singulisphaera acidiphila]|uniref:Uncharacterized protein n=1 Tax=Singulisphaera acidiphila (strain ATCC BAA-1392 / DSM 18658 / VKM B-2454 / MOB10) TaxID=886293 RepID=L0D7V9_SINAD|nr:hypothetical protein [Singulisphaera acidiphila]AGA24741.1 hypothetical protein Sinac_0294 [Singulisphaera acidiphila DSM 18658]